MAHKEVKHWWGKTIYIENQYTARLEHYLTRVHLGPYIFGHQLCLHVFTRGDEVEHEVKTFHTHPYDFASLILWGGYREQMIGGTYNHAGETFVHRMHVTNYNCGEVVRHTRFIAHRIEEIFGRCCITLMWRTKDLCKWKLVRVDTINRLSTIWSSSHV